MEMPSTTQSLPYNTQLSNLAVFRGRKVWVVLILLLGDLLSFALAFGLATGIRIWLIQIMGGVIPQWDVFLPLLQLNLISILITYALMGLYPGFGLTAVEEMRTIFNALTIGYGLLGLAVYLLKASLGFPRSVLLLGWALAFLLNTSIRFIIRNRASLLRWWGTPLAVVGHGEAAHDVIERLLHSRRMGLRPVIVLDESAGSDAAPLMGIARINSPEQLGELSQRYKINTAVFVESHEDTRLQVRQMITWLSHIFPTVLVALADSPFGSLWVRTIDLEGRLTLRTQYHLLDWWATLSKRLFDFILGLILAILSAPFLLLIAVLIRLDTPGPIFHSHERLGVGGKPFRCMKFRTMLADAEERLAYLLDQDPQAAAEYAIYHKLSDDPRITRVGRVLRKFSLDEIPQFWLVVSGHMSLVGPRAYLPRELPDMSDAANLILLIRPGLTGWWQVMGRSATTFRSRLQLDEYYISNWSLWLDIYILLKTFWVVLSAKGT